VEFTSLRNSLQRNQEKAMGQWPESRKSCVEGTGSYMARGRRIEEQWKQKKRSWEKGMEKCFCLSEKIQQSVEKRKKKNSVISMTSAAETKI
jgi:hypothetical protein